VTKGKNMEIGFTSNVKPASPIHFLERCGF